MNLVDFVTRVLSVVSSIDSSPPSKINPQPQGVQNVTNEWVDVKVSSLNSASYVDNSLKKSDEQKKYFDKDIGPQFTSPNIPQQTGGMLLGPDAPIFGGRGLERVPPGFGPPGFGPRGPVGGFGFDGRMGGGMQPRFDPVMPPGVGGEGW